MRKYIVTHAAGDARFCNGVIIADNYNHTLEAFDRLYREALKSFPGLVRGDVECRTVLQSRWCKHMPLVSFSLPTGATAEGWSECPGGLNDVYY